MTIQNSLVNKEAKKETISTFLTKPAIKARINQMMSGPNGEQFITSIVAATQQTPALKQCDPMSVFTAAMQGAALKLSPSPQLGHFYMVPFNKSLNVNGEWIKEKRASFIPGYKGYIQLAIRSGKYKDIDAFPIKEGEVKHIDRIRNIYEFEIIEDEEIREATPTTGYFFYFELLNGFRKEIYWPIKKMELHADKHVPSFSLATHRKLQAGEKVKDSYGKDVSGFWYEDFDSQGCKTMIRHGLSKWGILSVDMVNAMEKDIQSENAINEEIQEDQNEQINITPDKSDDPFA